eukprot:UN22365
MTGSDIQNYSNVQKRFNFFNTQQATMSLASPTSSFERKIQEGLEDSFMFGSEIEEQPIRNTPSSLIKSNHIKVNTNSQTQNQSSNSFVKLMEHSKHLLAQMESKIKTKKVLIVEVYVQIVDANVVPDMKLSTIPTVT